MDYLGAQSTIQVQCDNHVQTFKVSPFGSVEERGEPNLAVMLSVSVVLPILLQQKTRRVAAAVRVEAQDVALRVDPVSTRPDPKGRRYIDDFKSALAQ